MQGFYDNQIVNEIGKYIKKFDKSAVVIQDTIGTPKEGTGKLTREETAEVRKSAKALIKGDISVEEFNEEWGTELFFDDIPGNDPYRMTEVVNELVDVVREAKKDQAGGQFKAWKVEITPEMAESIQRSGQTAFMPREVEERITEATYTNPRTGQVSRGATHLIANPNAPKESTDRESPAYGFATTSGRIVDRNEAFRIAQESGQLKTPTTPDEQFNVDRGVLHSGMYELEANYESRSASLKSLVKQHYNLKNEIEKNRKNNEEEVSILQAKFVPEGSSWFREYDKIPKSEKQKFSDLIDIGIKLGSKLSDLERKIAESAINNGFNIDFTNARFPGDLLDDIAETAWNKLKKVPVTFDESGVMTSKSYAASFDGGMLSGPGLIKGGDREIFGIPFQYEGEPVILTTGEELAKLTEGYSTIGGVYQVSGNDPNSMVSQIVNGEAIKKSKSGSSFFDNPKKFYVLESSSFDFPKTEFAKVVPEHKSNEASDTLRSKVTGDISYMPREVKEPSGIIVDSGDKTSLPVFQKTKNGKPVFKKGDPIYVQEKYNLLNAPAITQYDGPVAENPTPFDFNSLAYDVTGPQQKKINSAIQSGAVDNLANLVVVKTNEALKNPEIAAGKGWYSRMRDNLMNALGEEGRELLSQLLGATSAKTPVNQNFLQAMDAYEGIKSGRYDENRKAYLEMLAATENGTLNDIIKERGYTADVKKIADDLSKGARKLIGKKKDAALGAAKDLRDLLAIKEDGRTDKQSQKIMMLATQMIPMRSNGKKFNANSLAVLKVIGGTWLANRNSPKTPNFAGNLSGRTIQATIDVWAARFLRQAMYEGYNQPWRIQPKSETGVTNEDFALGQIIFDRAAKKLGMNPDDLQAVLWFAEKHNWDERGWTKNEGAEKSSFDEIFHVFFPKGKKPLTFEQASKVFDEKKTESFQDEYADEESYDE
jgi:hypothetical protein